jgi:hypothetical protein
MKSNIVHHYFKKETAEGKILLMVDPIRKRVQEIICYADGTFETNEGDLELDDEALRAEGFVEASPLEFHLHLAGLTK